MSYSNIDKPSKYFNTVLYTGTGSNLAVTGVGFKPDWVWCKSRSAAEDHTSWDAVRGSTKRLSQNTTGAEYVDAVQGMQSFDTDGFTCGVSDQYNKSAQTQVSWCWLGANSTTSNTQGSITSTVSASQTSGFSIVSYTGTGATATVGHGLGVTPKVIIVKKRDSAGTDWTVWGSILGGTVGSEKIQLNLTNGKSTGLNSSWFNNTAPTSSVFTVGTQSDLNGSGGTYIGYCFAEVKGFSKAFSYTGNGSTDGTFVYCGFRPAWIMIKRTDTAQGWRIIDNKRLGYNPDNSLLQPHTSQAESALQWHDILSNGFKNRNTDAGDNASGGTYIGFAIAESPFVSSKGIPTTAR